MELTIEEFRQEIDRLDHKIEQEIASVKEAIAAAQDRTTQWVVGLFIGSAVLIAMLFGAYLAGMMLVVTR